MPAATSRARDITRVRSGARTDKLDFAPEATAATTWISGVTSVKEGVLDTITSSFRGFSLETTPNTEAPAHATWSAPETLALSVVATTTPWICLSASEHSAHREAHCAQRSRGLSTRTSSLTPSSSQVSRGPILLPCATCGCSSSLVEQKQPVLRATSPVTIVPGFLEVINAGPTSSNRDQLLCGWPSTAWGSVMLSRRVLLYTGGSG